MNKMGEQINEGTHTEVNKHKTKEKYQFISRLMH